MASSCRTLANHFSLSRLQHCAPKENAGCRRTRNFDFQKEANEARVILPAFQAPLHLTRAGCVSNCSMLGLRCTPSTQVKRCISPCLSFLKTREHIFKFRCASEHAGSEGSHWMEGVRHGNRKAWPVDPKSQPIVAVGQVP